MKTRLVIEMLAVASLAVAGISSAHAGESGRQGHLSFSDVQQHGKKGDHGGGCAKHGGHGDDCGHEGDHGHHGGPGAPEPETWLMLLGGVGLIATQLHRRQKQLQDAKI